MNPTPVAISALIISAVAFVGALIAYFRDRAVFRHHEEYRKDAIALAKEFGGNLFRDGNDLVLNGIADDVSFVVRFSYGEGTPGLNIRADVPASFQMSIAPKRLTSAEGRTEIRTTDRSFDAMFTVRSNSPTQAKLFIDRKRVLAELPKLCCSTNTLLGITTGTAELSELVIPKDTRNHVADHIRSLKKISDELRQMPFADRVVLRPVKRDRRLVMKLALTIGVAAAVVAVVSSTQQPRETTVPVLETDVRVPAGMPPADADVISSVYGWRLADSSDLDPDAVAWLNEAGLPVNSRLSIDLSGEGTASDLVYLLVNKDGQRRLVILVDHKVVSDVKYPYLGILARVPKQNVQSIEWTSSNPGRPDGDALLITRAPRDRSSGLLLYRSSGRFVTGTMANYQTLNLLP
jgi:hypothetical protein